MIRNHNWYNLNGTRHYPLDDNATGDVDGAEGNLPSNIIVDCNIRFPNIVGKYLYISSVHCTDNLVTLTFLAVDTVSHEVITTESSSSSSSLAPSATFTPVAVITVQNPQEYRPYPIDPLYPGTGGWVVFGEGSRSNFSGKFSTPAQTQLSPKVARWYEELPIPTIRKTGLADSLAGVVLLKGSSDVEIVKEAREIQGAESRDVIVMRCKSVFGKSVLDELVGPCGKRPESRNCDRAPIEYINTVPPDCDGNIAMNFYGFGVAPREFEGSSQADEPYPGRGITVDFGLGISDVCTVNDRIPDEDGDLPNDYTDLCSYSSSSSLSDSSSSSSSAGGGGDSESSEGLSQSSEVCGSLPYGTTFDDLTEAVLQGGIPVAPKDWQVKNGTWRFENIAESWLEYQGYGTQLSSSSSVGNSSSSASYSAYHIDRIYTNTSSHNQNVSVWTGCEYEAGGGSAGDDDISRNRRAWTDIMVPSQTHLTGSAGICLNHRISPFSGYPHYIFVSLDVDGDRLVISRWAGNAYQELAAGFPVALVTDKWYRLSVSSKVVNTISTEITVQLFDAAQFSAGGRSLSEKWPNEEASDPIKTVALTTTSFGNISGDYSYDGHAGVFASKIQAYFSHFNFDKDV